MNRNYCEIERLERELKQKQLEFIKAVLAENKGKVSLDYKNPESFAPDCDEFYEQFSCCVKAEGRHGDFDLYITSVYENNNMLFLDGFNFDTDSYEARVTTHDEMYSTIAYFLSFVSERNE